MNNSDDKSSKGIGQIIGGWLLLCFGFIQTVVMATIAWGNTQTWEGTAIPGDLTPTETLGEVTYQIWTATGCLVSVIIGATLIIIGAIKKRN